MPIFVFLLLFSMEVFAQHSQQPQKEDTSDLRSTSVLFSVQDIKNAKVFWLERTGNLDHFLRLKKDATTEDLRKVDSRDAKRLDMDFASRFLRCQYEHPSSEGECKVQFRLMMKGETLEICSKDEEKSQEIKAFIEDLHKRF